MTKPARETEATIRIVHLDDIVQGIIPEAFTGASDSRLPWYLSSPYSAYPLGPEVALRTVTRVAARLMAARLPVYSPIIQHIPVQEFLMLGGGHDPWWGFNAASLEGSAGQIIVRMTGWDESKGIQREYNYTRALGKPVIHLLLDSE